MQRNQTEIQKYSLYKHAKLSLLRQQVFKSAMTNTDCRNKNRRLVKLRTIQDEGKTNEDFDSCEILKKQNKTRFIGNIPAIYPRNSLHAQSRTNRTREQLSLLAPLPKRFIFDSSDRYIQEILLANGWTQAETGQLNCQLKWLCLPKSADYNCGPCETINHFKDSDCLTSKLGLKSTLQGKTNAMVSYEGKNYLSFWPRSYDLQTEMDDFVRDYHCTGVLNLVKKIMICLQIENNALFAELSHKVMHSSQEIAYETLNDRLSTLIIDKSIYGDTIQGELIINGPIFTNLLLFLRQTFCLIDKAQPSCLTNTLLTQLLHYGKLDPPYSQYNSALHSVSRPSVTLFFYFYKKCLHKYPWFRADALNNIWIIKASASSRGRNIFLIDDAKDAQIYNNGTRIIQKYLESVWIYRNEELAQTQQTLLSKYPFLSKMHGKKFDVRIWVLVKSFAPLEIYFYEQGYLRISRQNYQLLNIDRSKTHLTNYSINWNSAESTSLEDSYVLLSEFLGFLEEQGYSPKDKIIGDIKNIVLYTLQCAELKFKEGRRNSFELFGFDVILDSELKPWLLECNMSPACHERGQLKQVVREMGEGLLTILSFIDGQRYKWSLLVKHLPLMKYLPQFSRNVNYLSNKQITIDKNMMGASNGPKCVNGVQTEPTVSCHTAGRRSLALIQHKSQKNARETGLCVEGHAISWKGYAKIEQWQVFVEKVRMIQRFVRGRCQRREGNVKPVEKENVLKVTLIGLKLIEMLAKIVRKRVKYNGKRFIKQVKRKAAKLRKKQTGVASDPL